MRLSRFRVTAAAALLLVFAPDLYAATFTVDTTTDDPAKTACDAAVTDDCSLRGAITAANALAEPSTVNVPAGTYELTQIANCIRNFPGGGTQLLSQVPLCLTGQVTVQGGGAATTIIDGKDNHRVLFVSFGAVAEMRGVTLTHGVGEPLPEGGGADGGCVRNLGTLTLADSVVSNGTLPAGFGGAGAPGIFNVGALTLLRSTVASNVAQAAGGGAGVYNAGADAVLTVVDSIIRENTIPAVGGGIFNYGGATATVTGSTIVGNSTLTAQGGGIYNDATLTLIDSTISGNDSGSSGGGISNGQNGVVHLNNVTITNNTSGTAGAGRGGGVANASPSFTVRNTIIAGNTDLASGEAHPDCEAPGVSGFNFPLTSEGYNLVGDAIGCSIVGDLTGNLTGQPAKLGALVDSGGPTPTHAPADDSPAVGAGNPAAPGSGGAACAANDQRGFVRPIGERCDIGAFERGGPFAVVAITPPVGGNIGSVTVLISGNAFVDGATVKLVRVGESDVVGSPPAVDPGGSAITTTFDLVGEALGAWDVVVTNPDAASQTLAGGFTIEVGRAPDPWVDIVGGVLFRHETSPITIFYGNRGNVDATAVPLTLGATGAYGLRRHFAVARPPALPDQFKDGIWDAVGITVAAGEAEDFTNAPLLLPTIPAGYTGILRLGLVLPIPDPPDGTVFASFGEPYFTPALDPLAVAALVEGARSYSAAAFGVTIPSTLVPDITQYVTAQLEAVVDDGRDTLITSSGTASHIYSLAQLETDAALFGAARTIAQQASVAPLDLRELLEGARRVASLSSIFEPTAALAEKLHYTKDQHAEKCNGTLLAQGGSCDSSDESITPSGSDPDACNLDILLDYLTFDGPPPDCTPTKATCDALANHKVITLPGGAMLCVPNKSDCDFSRPDGYQNTSHCRAFPIQPDEAIDPNDKAGSQGVGAEQFVLGDTPSTYVIHFENLDTATAPAAIVVVSDPLDFAHLDLDTFSLGPISFGPYTLVPSPGLNAYSGSVDLRPTQNLVITVDASLSVDTGIVTWRFDSIDQATGQSTEDPAAGFLPPNVNPPAGEGLVSFSVRRTAGLAPGTAICNQASIVFDQNDPLATENWCNSIGTTTTTMPTTTTLPIIAACGDPVTTGSLGDITAADALRVLRTAVELDVCLACVCDVDDSGAVTASDALAVLRVAVGGVDTLTCPPCVP